MAKRKPFKCKSEKQKKAIRANYARMAKKAKENRSHNGVKSTNQQGSVNSDFVPLKPEVINEPLVPVTVKKRNDNNDGHFHVIFDTFEEHHSSVGITKRPKKGKNSPNYDCKNSILGNNVRSFARRQGTVAPVSTYSENTYSGNMTETAYNQAKIYAERAKEKFLAKRDNKNAKKQQKK